MNTIRFLLIILSIIVSATFINDINLSFASAENQVTRMAAGQRMYRDGLLPNGDVMQGFINNDVAVDSSAFSCSSCHMRAGLGSVEGGIVTPPTNGRSLYKPYRRSPSLDALAGRAGTFDYAKTIASRPAYTRESLAKSLRFGVDPAGQIFNNVMPRYPLSDADMNILVDYLDNLSSDFSPGVTPTSFSFATIITDEVSADDRKALLEPLQRFVAGRNQQFQMYQEFTRMNYSPTADMKYAFHSATLSVWELKGSPETWKAQLKAYYDKQPVFAVLGGISTRDWRPIHEFCEQQELPCLYPVTNLPVVSETSWYTFYFNKGLYQEGEATALFLNNQQSVPASGSILQIVQDSAEGRALADGFDKTWVSQGHKPVKRIELDRGRLKDAAILGGLLKVHNPSVLLMWVDGELVTILPEIMVKLGTASPVFVSSTYLGKQTSRIAESIRPRVFLTFPYRLTPYVGNKENFDAKVPILTTHLTFGESRISSRIETVLQQSVLQAIKQLFDNLYRDYLLDLMSMQMDQVVRDYERLSFGPGQRYASKGCYIIQLGAGEEPVLIPRSEWVMH